MADGDPPPLLEMRGIAKRFDSVRALDGVDFACAPREIHALLGENGAGKSTLIHVASGMVRPDAGEIRFASLPVRWRSPEEARGAGIATVHQHFMLVPTLTVSENVALARRALGPLRRTRLRSEVLALAAERGLPIGDPDRLVEDLSVGERQRVEILKALVSPTRLLVLDEPTAVLTPPEVESLFELLRRLADAGTGIVIVTHKLAEVRAIADRVTVLARGRVLGTGPASDFDVAALSALMVGDRRSPAAGSSAVSRPRPPRSSEGPLLVVEDLRARDERGAMALDGVSFHVSPGELLVIAGVDGNGQGELLDALAGVARASLRDVRGRVAVDGVDIATATAAREAGVAVVPADRGREGLVAELPAWENLLLARDLLAEQAPRGVLSPAAGRARGADLIAQFGVRPSDPLLPAAAFSGGNQQRLVLAREIGRPFPRVIVAANPTRGLDLAATAAVRERLREHARRGAAVVVLSTDLDEVEDLEGRVAVLYRGRLLAPRAEAPDRRQIGRLMAGLGEEAA